MSGARSPHDFSLSARNLPVDYFIRDVLILCEEKRFAQNNRQGRVAPKWQVDRITACARPHIWNNAEVLIVWLHQDIATHSENCTVMINLDRFTRFCAIEPIRTGILRRIMSKVRGSSLYNAAR